jgi:predicted pyridoxine 5'-phosphate oxidase superfamily flavin-nucleotide-binding protein
MKISDEIKCLFEKIPFMAFATVSTDNIPNVVAIGSKLIVNDDTIWIIDTFFDKTKANILQNNKVAISFWQGITGYQIKGDAIYHKKGELFEKAERWILKFKPNKIVKGVIEIKVTDIFSISANYNDAGKRIS